MSNRILGKIRISGENQSLFGNFDTLKISK